MDEILGRTRSVQNAVMYFVTIIVVLEHTCSSSYGIVFRIVVLEHTCSSSYGILFRIAVSYLITVAYNIRLATK